VNGDPSNVLAKGGLDDQLASQVKLVEAPLHLGTQIQVLSLQGFEHHVLTYSKYQPSYYQQSPY